MGIVGGYHHVHIIGRDPEAAAEWFAKYFDAEVVLREEPRGCRNVMMKVGEATLSVRTPRTSETLIDPGEGKPYGIDHICFFVDNLAEMIERMRGDGVEIAEEIFDHSGGSEAAFIVGPENVLFELIQKK